MNMSCQHLVFTLSKRGNLSSGYVDLRTSPKIHLWWVSGGSKKSPHS